MAQLTLYIDDETRERIEVAAKAAGTSVSAWAAERLRESLSTTWPEGYFELFGCLRGSDLERPKQLDPRKDVRRERL